MPSRRRREEHEGRLPQPGIPTGSRNSPGPSRQSGGTSGDLSIPGYVPETPVVPYNPSEGNTDPASAIISSVEPGGLATIDRPEDEKAAILTALLAAPLPEIGKVKEPLMPIDLERQDAKEELKKAAEELANSREPADRLPGLGPEESKNANIVLRRGVKANADPEELLAAAETGLVESGFKNYTDQDETDADSLGWRQERTSLYPLGPQGPTNVRASADRFYDELKTDLGAQDAATPGLMAQAAQGSAYPEKYDEREAEAQAILEAFKQGQADPQARREFKQAKAQALKLGIPEDKIMGIIHPGGQEDHDSESVMAKIQPGGDKLWGGKKRGKVTFADWMTEEQITGVTNEAMRLGRAIAGGSGIPVNVISGARPGSITTSGNVSDHSSGNALDIEAYDAVEGGSPEDVAKGDRIATTAARVAGADIDSPEFKSFIENGGVYETVSPSGYRVQILWKTDEGGNHHNHVHVGIRPEEGATPGYLSSSSGGYTGSSSGSTSLASMMTPPTSSSLMTAALDSTKPQPAGDSNARSFETVMDLLESPVPTIGEATPEGEDDILDLILRRRV